MYVREREIKREIERYGGIDRERDRVRGREME